MESSCKWNTVLNSSYVGSTLKKKFDTKYIIVSYAIFRSVDSNIFVGHRWLAPIYTLKCGLEGKIYGFSH